MLHYRSARMAQHKRQIAYPDPLWEELGLLATLYGTSIAELVRSASRFRCSYARAAERAKSNEPADVFAVDPRLVDDLRRWHNGQ